MATASAIPTTPEAATSEALIAMDSMKWALARSLLLTAIEMDDQFMPAWLLSAELYAAKPTVFQPEDPISDHALYRVRQSSPEAKERGKKFVESLAETTTSGHCMFLVGAWKHRVEVDYAQAVKWYRWAVAERCASAEARLGLCYMDGEGVDWDGDEGKKWLHSAAIHGHADALSHFVRLSNREFGRDVPMKEIV